jgi:hypothetical protein
MRDLRSIHISGQWDEFTAHRIRKETERLYPRVHRPPRPRLSLFARWGGEDRLRQKPTGLLAAVRMYE